ncbi:MAG: DNA methyltransferase, partial [Promethearchaeota archaeon]
ISKILKFVEIFESSVIFIWNRIKAVKNSNYVITFNKILNVAGGQKIINEIIKNENFPDQFREWKELGLIDPNLKQKDMLTNTLIGIELRRDFLYLPLDTRYFKEIESRLLNLFIDLDDQLDGWLIKSDNYQALITLHEKFKNKIQTIYIDPPFNKPSESDYSYNVKYDDDVWLSMLENRLSLARDFLKDTGDFFLRCDYRGNMHVRYLLDDIFGPDKFRNEIIINRTKGRKKITNRFPNIKDSLFFYGMSNDNYLNKKMLLETNEFKVIRKILKKIKSNKELQKKKDIIKKISNIITENLWLPLDHRPGERKKTINRQLFGKSFPPPPGRHWIKTQSKLDSLAKKGKARLSCKCGYVHTKKKGPWVWDTCPKCKGTDQRIEIVLDKEPITEVWLDIPGYSQTWGFSTENAEELLQRIIEASTTPRDIVMDFFLGSGTTIATAHKLGRRWIGIEMGSQFDSIILKRLKMVLSGHESGITKKMPVNKGGFFKYYELDSFEDCLGRATIIDKDVMPLSSNESTREVFTIIHDKKFLEFVKDRKEMKPFVNIQLLKMIFPSIDIVETISLLTGKKIMKINQDKVLFSDGFELNLSQIPMHLIEKLAW